MYLKKVKKRMINEEWRKRWRRQTKNVGKKEVKVK
jgi:hypothetical protein